MRVLLIKMSSLGDVVHALPAVTDAAAHGVEFHWVVEEAFASVPAMHPAVEKVLPIAWRRWRQGLLHERQALADFFHRLRHEHYDLVLDAQGLYKSAIVTALARADVKAGLSFSSARESAAALFYNRRVVVAPGGHAVDRLRLLFATTLGYPLPEQAAAFGLPPAEPIRERGENVCLLLHGTTWPSKHWPLALWRDLAKRLAEDGWRLELPWGSAAERKRAEQIAESNPAASVLPPLSLAQLSERIGSAGLVVGVDSGLTHLAGARGVPAVVIYGATSAIRTGARGARVLNLQSDLHCSPCLNRQCRYRGEPQYLEGEVVSPACYARVSPEQVRAQALNLLETRD